MPKPSPSPVLRPIPAFANRGVLCADFSLFASPPTLLLALFDRTLAITAATFWQFGIGGIADNTLILGRDSMVVPNGAEFFSVTANNAVAVPGPVYNRITVRWRLHI